MSLKVGSVVVLSAFAISFAYLIGTRMSPEAIDMAVGVLCGIAASIPVSIGLFVALTRDRRPEESEREVEVHPVASGYPRAQAPQIIVLAPPNAQLPGQGPMAYMPGQQTLSAPPEQYGETVDGRDWRIIGDDE